jgi:DNA-binding NarL/FixJ family response regulator
MRVKSQRGLYSPLSRAISGLSLRRGVGRRREHRAVPVTVVIVDDHAGFRDTARRLLEEAGYDVVGEAADGGGALIAVAAFEPQLLVLDIQLPDIDGFAVAERLAEAGSETVVVVTSSRLADEYRGRLARSRAPGFIPKTELSGTALAEFIRTG